jgi:hypothetical protein
VSWREGAKSTHRRLALSQTVLIKAQAIPNTDGEPGNAKFQKVKFVEDFGCPCGCAAFRFQNSSFQNWGAS